MNSNQNSSSTCSAIVGLLQNLLSNCSNNEFSKHLSSLEVNQLASGCKAEKNEEVGDMYSRPMFAIGIYIALASFLCVLAMAADVIYGIRNRKLWIPCKYLSLNAACITVIAVAIKLPVDLTTQMGDFDEAAKLVSLAFMSIMMLHIMPSLASMDNKTLVANVIGLSILAIGVCVNTYIQIHTTLISHINGKHPFVIYYDRDVVAYIYTGFILVVLIIMISLSLAIPGFKEIIDSKYQLKKKYLTDQPIEQFVRRYWVMAQTGSPQFMILENNPLIEASETICYALLFMTMLVLGATSVPHPRQLGPLLSKSPYKWSTDAILYTQLAGLLIGAISSTQRHYPFFSYRVGDMKFLLPFSVFRVEGYWTKKLHEWKQHRILFLSSSPSSRRFIHILKDIILSLCILFQIVVVFLSKVILLITNLMHLVLHALFVHLSCGTCCTPRPITSTPEDIDPDLNDYVLSVDHETQINERVRNNIFKSVNSYISEAEKEQNKYLFELIEQSTRFEGVKTFDTNHSQPLLPALEDVSSWSLPIVTLTCIALALPNIPKDKVNNLFESVNEGLSYTHLVEESFNHGNKYVKLQKVSMALWLEVDNKGKWLGIPLAKDFFKGKKAIEIAKWFSDRAKEIVIENMSTNHELVENMDKRVIAANSMYRITETILHRFQSTEVTKRQMFAHLRGMIADIFSACFTNIPQVIKIKCSESVIENREENVKAAAKLLGKTTEIRKMLDSRQVPLMDMDKMAYIDEWRNMFIP